MPPLSFEIRLATVADLRSIGAWLKRWHDRSVEETGGSFWFNFNLVKEGRRKGELWALREAGKSQVLAFCLGNIDTCSVIDILEVHPDHRRRGLGRTMVEHFKGEARKKDCIGIYVDCKPRSSIPFWESLGFVDVSAETDRPDRYALLLPTIGRPPLPDGKTLPVRVTLSFYGKDLLEPPFETVAAVDGERFVLQDEYLRHVKRDTYAEIRVGDEILHKYKLKYVQEVGGDRMGDFVRIRELYRKQAE